MVTIILCSIVLVAAAIFSFVNYLKGNEPFMWLGVVVVVLCLLIGIPEVVDLAKAAIDKKIDGVFDPIRVK